MTVRTATLCAACGEAVRPRCGETTRVAELGSPAVAWHERCAKRDPLAARLRGPKREVARLQAVIAQIEERGPGRVRWPARARACLGCDVSFVPVPPDARRCRVCRRQEAAVLQGWECS